MNRVKYPNGLQRGDKVRLLRELRTRRGEVFKVGEVLVVGSASRSRIGERGRPRIDLWDPEKGHYDWDGKGSGARGIRNVQMGNYKAVEERLAKR